MPPADSPTRTLHWPRMRSLGLLLQSPAHRVVRVLHVTQSHWQVPERRRAVPQSRPLQALAA